MPDQPPSSLTPSSTSTPLPDLTRCVIVDTQSGIGEGSEDVKPLLSSTSNNENLSTGAHHQIKAEMIYDGTPSIGIPLTLPMPEPDTKPPRIIRKSSHTRTCINENGERNLLSI